MNRKRSRSLTEHHIQSIKIIDYRPYTSGLLEKRLLQLKQRPPKDQWNCYYRNNTINGYKDRHYIIREFDELRNALISQDDSELKDSERQFSWMEAGCGVGNTIMPVLSEYGHLPRWSSMYGFDISSVAIELLREKVNHLPDEVQQKIHLCTLDPTKHSVTNCTELSNPKNVSFLTMIFVLCSIAVDKHESALLHIAECLKKPGGIFFFRDYAASDHAQSRFESRYNESNEETSFLSFERCNGTLTHFFTLDEVEKLFINAGFSVIELKIVERDVTHHKEGKTFHRKFIQGRFCLNS